MQTDCVGFERSGAESRQLCKYPKHRECSDTLGAGRRSISAAGFKFSPRQLRRDERSSMRPPAQPLFEFTGANVAGVFGQNTGLGCRADPAEALFPPIAEDSSLRRRRVDGREFPPWSRKRYPVLASCRR